MTYTRVVLGLFFIALLSGCSDTKNDLDSSGERETLQIKKDTSVAKDTNRIIRNVNHNYGLKHLPSGEKINGWDKSLIVRNKVKSIKIVMSERTETSPSFDDTIGYISFDRKGFIVRDSLKNEYVRYYNYSKTGQLMIEERQGEYREESVYTSDNRLTEQHTYKKDSLRKRTVWEYDDTILFRVISYNPQGIITDSINYQYEVLESGGLYKKISYEEDYFDELQYDKLGRQVTNCGTMGNVVWCLSNSYDTLENGEIRETIEVGGNGGRQGYPTVNLYNVAGKILLSDDGEEGVKKTYSYDAFNKLVKYSEVNMGDNILLYEEIHSYDLATGLKKEIRIYSDYNNSVNPPMASVITTYSFVYEYYEK